MDPILLLFGFLIIPTVAAWMGKYRCSILFFIFFLILAALVFYYQMTDSLIISL